jgi:hypothetical protein
MATVLLAQVRDPWTPLWLEVCEFSEFGSRTKRAALALKFTVEALPHAQDFSTIVKRLANYDWVFGNVGIGKSTNDRWLTLHFIYFSFGRLAEDYSRLGGILENRVLLETALLRMHSRPRAKARTNVAKMLLRVDDLPQEVRVAALSRALETFGG